MLLSAALALTAAPAVAAPGKRPSDPRPQTHRGIVQTVSAKAVVLKQLDGSTLTVSVDARTRVLVDGKRATLAAVRPGFVAIAVFQAGKPARELQAFSRAPRTR